MITLYDYELSGNCYKLRLLMSILGVDAQDRPGRLLSRPRAQVATGS